MGYMLDEATTVPEHRAIKDEFSLQFPCFNDKIVRWGKYDLHGIFVELKNGEVMIFSKNGIRDWCLESINHRLKRREKA